MLTRLKQALGMGPAVDFKGLMQKGAVIIDVRSAGEFQGGHIKNAINIPLNNLPGQLAKIKKDKPVITCCASGMRSASAKNILQSAGFKEVYNGGGWTGLEHKLA